MERPFISIVIPAYNEGTRIGPTLEKIVDFLSGQPYVWEVIVVDDGSSDDTADVANNWVVAHDRVRSETIPHAGKGWAVRHGMLSATGQYRFMCDADLAMPIEWLQVFLERMEEGHYIVAGSRQIAGARRFDESILRHAMGRIFNWSVRLVAVGGFQDTQCGFKCFRGEVADELFGLQRTRGFGFDVEILYLASKKRSMSVLEMPIDWYHQKSSRVSAVADSFLMLRDAILVRVRDAFGGYNVSQREESTSDSADALHMKGASQASQVEASVPPVDGAVAVVVPTFNEASNLGELTDRLFALGIPNARLIVVDDNSPDGTAELAEKLAEKYDNRVELIQRPAKLGLGTAYVEGFSHALGDGADYVLQMDADLSHAPEYVPAFLETLREAEVVVGSRYVRGGGVDEHWSVWRRGLSYLANLGIRRVTGLKVRDATTGFKGFQRGALSSLKFAEFKCKGFGFQAEVAYECQRQGFNVVEHPITFVDRTKGQSKMSIFIALEALWYLLLLRLRRARQVSTHKA